MLPKMIFRRITMRTNRIEHVVFLALLFLLGVDVHCAGLASAANATSSPLQILRITPQGMDVLAGRQIVFQFDRAVVPIGRMERASESIPVTIKPALQCAWRWLNTSALACQLDAVDQMTNATRYEVVMNPGIVTQTGVGIDQATRFSFTTLRPAVTYARFINWLSPGTPLLQVTFNQAVKQSSVEQALSFVVGGTKVPIVAFPDDRPRRAPYWSMAADPSAKVDDRHVAGTSDDARRVWVVEPRSELALDAHISLNVAPGLQSSAGLEAGSERREIVTFDTYPEFRFLGIRCTLRGNTESSDLTVAELDSKAHQCAPLKTVALNFSAPVLNSNLKQHVDFSPALNGGREDYDPWQNAGDWSRLSAPHRKGRTYLHWLPELLAADQAYDVVFDRTALRDEFGRALTSAIDFRFHTSHREPNLRLAHRNAVLEQGIDSDVPLYVTNLDSIDIRYDKLTSQLDSSGLAKQLVVPEAQDISFALPLSLRALLANASGAVHARLRPQPTPPNWYRDPEILAQVTPFQVHYKLGHFNSLAWVTEFATGLAVEGAKVTLHVGARDQLTNLSALPFDSRTDRDGLAELPGLETIDPQLHLVYGYDNQQLFAKVEKDGALALLPIDYDFAVHGNGTYPRLQRRGGHMHAWGTTAQGVYKLGDTIEYKIYVRDQSQRHWIRPADTTYVLKITDPQGKLVHEQTDLRLNEFGATDGAIKVPELGAVGYYRFTLHPSLRSTEKRPRFSWQPLSVLVSDFTPSPFKVTSELNGERFKSHAEVMVTTSASLHAGGPFTAAEVRLSASLSPGAFTSDHPLAEGFSFGSDNGRGNGSQRLLDVRAKLNEFGQLEKQFRLPESNIYFGSINVESAVKDDRGKFIAATSRAEYAGRDHYVGLRNTRWLHAQGKAARLEAIVVDVAGNPVANGAVAIVINRRVTKAARVKGPGNAYLTQNISSWVAESVCQLRTVDTQPATCEFVPQAPGYYQFIATSLDSKGRAHQTILNGWVTGNAHVVYEQSNNANLELVAEKKNYAVGETARYLVKNPYPGAQALVSVERYGVLERWIETFDTTTPVIEIPVKPDYLPGFYVSVVVVSPRVADAPLAGKVDLGKPSYRLGYGRTQVNDPYKRLAVAVATPAKSYKPRDTVKASIKVNAVAGKLDQPIEIAVAVVDEAVLTLNRSGIAYYDPYAGFNRLDALDVNNYSLMSRLIGRQKFEKKGANPGGGGGSDNAQLRNLFKFVSYWNPSIKPDPAGRAAIEFEVPDNLTGWRILVLAVTPDDRMGLGEANIKVNRPTEIRPVMPNQLLAGDRFKAGFTVMNRTERKRRIVINIDANGPLKTSTPTTIEQTIEIAPYARELVMLPLVTGGAGEISFKASAGDASDRDAIAHTLSVKRRRSLESAANYGSTTQDSISEPFQIPNGIFDDVGTIGATLSPSVIGNIDGAFEYLKSYPHRCWEQRLSKAVAASSYLELEEYVGDSLGWPSSREDIAHALQSAANFQAPNGGMAYWFANNQTASAYLSAYTAMAFNWLKRNGEVIPGAIENRLHAYLLEFLRRDVYPSFYSDGMASSVRAVALAALAGANKISVDDVQRYARHVPQMDLFGKAHFLNAALNFSDIDPATVANTSASILAHAVQSGGKFQFNEAWDDSYKYVLATPLRSNCAVLSSLLRAEKLSSDAANISDIPFKLMRSITQSRGSRDHFENTQENIFCMNAIVDYAHAYEQDPPNMLVEVALDGMLLGKTRFNAKTDAPVTVERSLQSNDVGAKRVLTIDKAGSGRLYYAARLAYDLTEDNAARINAGIEIRREYSIERNGRFELLPSPMNIKRGDVVRVDLFLSAPSARHFVVVDDPIPGGLEAVNADLATSSRIDAAKGAFRAANGSWFYKRSDWSHYGRYFWSFYHRELRFEAARFYADYLPAGNYHLSYTAQAIAPGTFSVMPSKVEEMYDPDVYGRGLPASLVVEQ